MEATHLVTTLPVTSAEMHDTTANHAPTVAYGPVVATMGRRRHHSRRTIATISVSAAANLINGTSTNSWEGASEASSSALEVGEATRGTSPATRTGPVLAGRERNQDALSAVEDAARRRRDLDGLLVQGTTVHAETLGSLLVGRENHKSSASRLVLLKGTQSPESNGTAAKLGEPALKLGLSSIVRQSRHVKNLALLRKEGSNIGSGVHGSANTSGCSCGGRLAAQATENAGEGDSHLHRSARQGRGQGL
jgi:hypothetical protein